MKALSGCFNNLLSGFSLLAIMSGLIILMIIVSTSSLYFANAFEEESCGNIHPNVFEVEVFIIDSETGTVSTSPNTNLPYEPFNAPNISGVQLDTTLAVYIDVAVDGEELGEILYDFNDDDIGLSSALYDVSITPAALSDLETGDDVVINNIIVEVGTYQSLYDGNFTLEILDYNNQFDDIDAVAANEPDLSVEGNSLITTGTINAGETVRYEFSPELFASGVHIYVFGSDGISDTDSSPSVISPENEAEVRTLWRSCLSYYGYFGDGSFVINQEGFNQFVPENTRFRSKVLQTCGVEEGPEAFSDIRASGCALSTNVKISDNGRLVFFFAVPLLVIVLPIAIAGAIAKRGGWMWFIFMIFVAIQANATALMLVHLSQVSQIESLSEFGYGIFTGIITGAALAFLDQLMDRVASKDDNSA